jgi:hypothetical protein
MVFLDTMVPLLPQLAMTITISVTIAVGNLVVLELRWIPFYVMVSPAVMDTLDLMVALDALLWL